MLQTLTMLERFDIRNMGWASVEKYHVLAEALRRSYADRAEYMGDPDFTDVPVSKLLDKTYLAARAATIDLRVSKSSGNTRRHVGSGTY